MTYLLLFWEFFKIGLFAIGGGLATIPFLYDLSSKYPSWFTSEMLGNMIAVSESTPGPIGINMATYAGFHATGNVLGSIIATLSITLPSLIVITIISKFLTKYNENKNIKSAFYGMRPAVLAFIVVTTINIFIENIFPYGTFDYKSLLLFLVLLAISNIKFIKKLHPIFIIIMSAIVGIVFNF